MVKNAERWCNLKYHVLNTIAECWAKRIGCVGRRRPVEHDGFCTGS